LSEGVEAIIDGLLSGDRERIVSALDALDDQLRSVGGDPSLIEPLNDLLSGDHEIKRKSAWALGKMAQIKVGSVISVDPLNAILMDEDDEVRENAAWAIGELAGMGKGLPSSLPLLNDLLHDPNPHVRSMAAWAIGRLAERANLKDPKSKEGLQLLLDDPSQLVRKSADWAIERVQPPTDSQ
jgi:HEAT repeat protein